MHRQTQLTQLGNRKDSVTGAVSLPIYHATTYAHPALGQSTGFDYTRTLNPTRKALEDAICELEGGIRGFAYASGMAAVHGVLSIFQPGDHLVVSSDLYGGTYRLFEQVLRPLGIEATYVNTHNLDEVRAAFRPNTKALFLETPTNPTMQITDIEACVALAKGQDAWTIVDNTFMSPYLQQPLALGADIVLHSATKYLGGHNDVLAGLVVTNHEKLADRLYFYQNSIGAVLGPDDCWLLIRGMKTLGLRIERHQENAQKIAEWLSAHKHVARVYYPGLIEHPGHTVQASQAAGFGGMLSFEVADEKMVEPFLKSVQLVTFAESLGGVESLVTYPARQTHFDIPEDVRIACGVTNQLLRLSVGVEHVSDIIHDLDAALNLAARVVFR